MTLKKERRKLLNVCLPYDVFNERLKCQELVAQFSFISPNSHFRLYQPVLHLPRYSTNYAKNCALTHIARIYINHFSVILTAINLHSCNENNNEIINPKFIYDDVRLMSSQISFIQNLI